MHVPLRALAASASLAALAACGGAPEPAPPTAPAQPVQALASCDLPADSIRFLVVLDHSGSMGPHWEEATRSLPRLVDALPDGSWLHVELFSSSSAAHVHDEQVRPDTRQYLKDQLASLPRPASNAPTDIGTALARAADGVQWAREHGRGALTFLFFISDGRQDPPAGSRFGDPAAWRPLRERWHGLAEAQHLQLLPYAVPVGSGGIAGADTVRWVVPHTRAVMEQTPGKLGEILENEIRTAMLDLRRTRALPEVETPRLSARLVDEPLTVPFRGEALARAVVRSRASCVTYALTAGPDSAPPILLAPGDSAQVALPMRTVLGWTDALPWKSPRRQTLDAASDSLPLVRSVGFEPRAELAALTIDPAPRPERIATRGTVEYGVLGRAWAIVPAGVLLLGLALAFLRFARPPRVWGEVRSADGTRTDLGESGRGVVALTLANGTEVRFVARKRNPFGDGYDSRVGVRAPAGTSVQVSGDEGVHLEAKGKTVWLHQDCEIKVAPADGSEPATLRWG